MGNTDKSRDNYEFPILQHDMNVIEAYSTIRNTISYINKWIRFIGREVGITPDITFIQAQLRHADLKTTRHYLADYIDEVKKANVHILISFKNKTPTTDILNEENEVTLQGRLGKLKKQILEAASILQSI